MGRGRNSREADTSTDSKEKTQDSMVELVYYELRGRSCRKILRRNGSPHKLLLFPEESWARSATTAYWLLSVSWWSRSRCRITEVSGSQKRSARAKIHEIEDSTLCIIGSFKTGAEPDFKLVLTSDVAQEDFNMGYSLTGLLERGDRRKYGLQPSHFVAVRRKELEPESTRLYHVYSNFTASSLYDIYDYQ
ncbi:unnamed protein product [Allacma fusca]|uniref:Uncharacterized protein n=1 Tax=Allacma fusca TaxID=39272 RepID=A0A8J2L272_9HEXA|nr:unnamed protein product [Allacma fusca]